MRDGSKQYVIEPGPDIDLDADPQYDVAGTLIDDAYIVAALAEARASAGRPAPPSPVDAATEPDVDVDTRGSSTPRGRP
ncbi:MAG: hypothetical protein EPO13_07610 [Actinomycetota bacterium]|nr:MAG: hypothetical protein EPO13_07610 [Actinomycetota bacterium]